MNIIDLSHALETGMPVFPGDPAPRFTVQGDLASGDAFTLIRFEMTTHTGTHVDCDTHIFPDGFRTDGTDLSRFVGRGVAIDCRMFGEGERIPAGVFQNQDLSQKEFVLLCCGWDKHWGTEKFFGDYPVLSAEAAEYLSKLDHIRGIGVEYPSIDPLWDEALTLHRILLGGKDKCVIENLRDLDRLLGRDFLFSALPLKFRNGEGSPVRAAALMDWE